jgi:hypothetical protein
MEAIRRLRFSVQVTSGKYVSAPHTIKMRVLKSYFPRCSKPIFVETGTFLGDTVAAVKSLCERVVSIEIQPELHWLATRRFMNDDNVELICGDCVHELPLVLRTIQRPAVFWLDGHYSGGATGRGIQSDPIITSLRQIGMHAVRNHTLLIDDARCFTSQDDSPAFSDVIRELHSINPHYRLSVHHDIIVATVGELPTVLV